MIFKSKLILGIAISALTAGSYAQWSNPANEVPAYHSAAPLKYPWQVHVYQQAAKIGNVIYQLPCNCRCDRALGHTSLRSCYEGYHGTECSTCAQEAFYAYAMTKAGKTPADIRAGISQHAYEQINLEQQ